MSEVHHAERALPKKGVWNFVLWLARPHYTIGRVRDTFFGQSPRSV